MSKYIVITGTGTEIGKTYFGCLLAEFAAGKGVAIKAIKPVESGCDGTFVEDGQLLARATRQASPTKALYRLKAALAPCVAADLEDVTLNPLDWVAAIRDESRDSELTMVETAGGLLSPLAWGFDTTHLAQELAASCIVVAANRLGCIHEIRTVLAVLRHENIPVSAVVLNSCTADQSSASNLETLQRVEPDVPAFVVEAGGDVDSSQEALRGIVALLGIGK